jgi:RHS repeat-associated protein
LHSYGYDDLHRLTSANHPAGSALDVKNEVFAYDSVGNRQSDAVRAYYTYDTANRLNEDSLYSYTYDLNGNRTGQTEKATNAHTTYGYNVENQLISATMSDGTVANYKYDALGRNFEQNIMTSSGVSTLRYLYDGLAITAVLDGNNNLISQFTHGPRMDEPLIIKSSNSADYYYHADGLGSITGLTNSNGEVIETVEYQAYGKPVIKSHEGTILDRSLVGNFYLYTGQAYSYTLGLYFFKARELDQNTGGFIQEDIATQIWDPMALNKYGYALGNPNKYVDPDGMTAIYIDIERSIETNQSTIGRLSVNMNRMGYTLELPWRNNTEEISRIPAGRYIAKPARFSIGGYRAILLSGTNPRSGVYIHIGNYPWNTHGCILPGEGYGKDSVGEGGTSAGTLKKLLQVYDEVAERDRLLGQTNYLGQPLTYFIVTIKEKP